MLLPLTQEVAIRCILTASERNIRTHPRIRHPTHGLLRTLATRDFAQFAPALRGRPSSRGVALMSMRLASLRPIVIAATITAILLIFSAGVLHAPAGSVRAASGGQGVCSALQSQAVACAADDAPMLPAAPSSHGSPR
jgi:hypothetical protein